MGDRLVSVALSDRRLRLGRLQFYVGPRDAVYVLALPFLVARWSR